MIFDFLNPSTDIKTIDRSVIISAINKRQQYEMDNNLSHDRSERLFRVIRSILNFALNRAYIDKNPANDIRYQTALKVTLNANTKPLQTPKSLQNFMKLLLDIRAILLQNKCYYLVFIQL